MPLDDADATVHRLYAPGSWLWLRLNTGIPGSGEHPSDVRSMST